MSESEFCPLIDGCFYRSLFEAAGDAIFVCDAQGRAFECNPAALSLLRCTRDELIGTTPVDWSPEVQPDGRRSDEKAAEILSSAVAGGSPHFDWINRCRDGSLLQVDVTVRQTTYEGRLIFVVISRDVSLLKALEKELRLSEEKFSKAFRDNPDPIILSEIATGLIREVNRGFTEVFGYKPEEIIGRTAADVGLWVDNRQREETVALMREKGQLRNYEVDFRAKDGDIRTVLGSSSQIDIDGIPYWLVHFRDITERKRLQRELEQQAHTDALTEVSNRRYFLELAESELSRAQRYGRPLTMIMLDVDHFKLINDRHGHLVGDKALRALTEVCRANLREVDVIGRMGGEEFAILLPETPLEQGIEAAERLRKAVAGFVPDIPAKDGWDGLTISIGVAAMDEATNSIDGLLGVADRRLYRAKAAGRNRVFGTDA